MTDYDKWLELWKFAQDNKLPQGEYCLWGKECAQRVRNDTHEGRHVFYLNSDGFSISTRTSDYHGDENFSIKIRQDYGEPDCKVVYDFGFCPNYLMLTPGQDMTELAEKFVERLKLIDVDQLVAAMRGDFEYYLENRERMESEKRQREIEAKERELAKLKAA